MKHIEQIIATKLTESSVETALLQSTGVDPRANFATKLNSSDVTPALLQSTGVDPRN